MPIITRAGVDLHYQARGPAAGPAVVLLHPLCYDHTCFDASGLTQKLVDTGSRVILPTSIAHRLSGSPRDAARYALHERVSDVQAVLEAEKVASFAAVGYSMGGWIATGLVAADPRRVTALAIGGWDPVGGAAGHPLIVRPALLFIFWIMRRRARWLAAMLGEAPDRRGLRLAFRELYRPHARLDSAMTAQVPTLLWSGLDDAYHERMQRSASDLGAEFVSLPGSHANAIFNEQGGAAIAQFLQKHPPIASR